MADLTSLTWTERTARSWLAGSRAPFAWALKGLSRSQPIQWHEGRDLPAGFSNLSASPGQCLPDALRAAEQALGSLVVAIGFSFRPEQPDRGSPHVFCIAPDGLPVDPSTRIYGADVGYLAAVPTVEHLRLLAASNGLQVPVWLCQ